MENEENLEPKLELPKLEPEYVTKLLNPKELVGLRNGVKNLKIVEEFLEKEYSFISNLTKLVASTLWVYAWADILKIFSHNVFILLINIAFMIVVSFFYYKSKSELIALYKFKTLLSRIDIPRLIEYIDKKEKEQEKTNG